QRRLAWFYAGTWRYQRAQRDHRSSLRDEEGLLNGPGMRRGLTHLDIHYPTGEEHGTPARADLPAGVPRLKIPRDLWADALPAERPVLQAPVGGKAGWRREPSCRPWAPRSKRTRP